MKNSTPLLALLACASLSGCGMKPVESTAPAPGTVYGGILVPLTNDRCYVELLNDKRERKGKVFQTTIVAYLLQADRKTPLAEEPASVQVKIDTPKGPMTVPLQPAPGSGEPAGTRRFASPLGPIELNQTGGEVAVLVGGETLTGTFRGPR